MPAALARVRLAPLESRGHLPRAAWQILTPKQLADAEVERPPQELDDEGARLVGELAASWCGKYSYTIQGHGAHGGAFHYECIFSAPANEKPVPDIVVRTRFAFVVPRDSSTWMTNPQLVFSFEEGDLRHAWKLLQDSEGRWQTSLAQQDMSLRHGYFERYLDRYILEKRTVRSRGISLVTPFEETRLPMPQESIEEDEFGLAGGGDGDVPLVGANSAKELHRPPSKTTQSGFGRGHKDEPAVDPDMQQALESALKQAGIAGDKVPLPKSLSELLVNVFDAADEEGVGELPHHEVARVLIATLSGLGLEPWDIQQLLATSQENEEGFIECGPFIERSPELIKELRERRLTFLARGLPGVEISAEAVKHCFGAEVGETADTLMQLFMARAQEDLSCAKFETLENLNATGSGNQRKSTKRSSISKASVDLSSGQPRRSDSSLVLAIDGEQTLAGLKRQACRECIEALPRVSPQEAQRLMQIFREDEDGFVQVKDLIERFEDLRSGALLNALVESDPQSLRKHLVESFRNIGMDHDGKMKLWKIKNGLLQADQICLSRHQILLLCCLASPSVDQEGNVDVADFLGNCSVVIPHMFDAKKFVQTAERLILEAAEQQRLRENAEIAALGASKVESLGHEATETKQEVQADQETVEKALIQVFTFQDDLKRNPAALPPETLFAVLHSGDSLVQSCQLSDHEICGFVAEMNSDARGEVAYVEHVKRVVQMIFELRRNQLLNAYLQENAFTALEIPAPNLSALEKLYPLLTPEMKQKRSPSKQPEVDDVMVRRASRRHTTIVRLGSKEHPREQGRLPSKRPTLTDDSQEDRIASKARLRLSTVASAKDISFRQPSIGEDREPPPGRGYQRRRLLLESLGST